MVVYNYDNIRKFLERQLPFLMTNLVLLSSQRNVGPALDFISNQVEKKPKKLLADHFPTIFTKIVTKVRKYLSQTLKKCATLQYSGIVTKLKVWGPKLFARGYFFLPDGSLGL